ncbi:acyltransferase family protein [Candidatus Woesebacteria bacterium]|nr:acyltransferase family protein [Candidatus Woesebacteria bacterium]
MALAAAAAVGGIFARNFMGINKRIIALDVTRITALFGVILLHTLLDFTLRAGFFRTPVWFLLEPIIVLSRTGVLLFFFISGYLVVEKNRSLGDNWRKLIRRIGIPLLTFQILLLIYRYFAFSTTNLHTFFLREVLRMTTFLNSHLWFLEVLFVLYLFNPVWQLIFAPRNKRLAQYITGIAFLFSLVTTAVSTFLSFDAFTVFTAWTGFVWIYLYGALVKRKWAPQVRLPVWAGVLFFSVCMGILGDYVGRLSMAHGVISNFSIYTMNYLSLNGAFAALAIFHILLKVEYKKYLQVLPQKIGYRILEKMAELSFGIYLIHPFVIGLLTDGIGFRFDNSEMNLYLYILIFVSAVLGTSILLTMGIKRLPILKQSIGFW